MARFVTGSSAPPLLLQIGLPACTVFAATVIGAMTASGPNGLRNPRAVSVPPANSLPAAAIAQRSAGLRPIEPIIFVVPSSPGPSNQPNSFWAPWPATSPPKTSRKINRARSLMVLPPPICLLSAARTVPPSSKLLLFS